MCRWRWGSIGFWPARRFAGGPYEFRHVGGVVGDFPAEDLALVGARPGFLDRA